MPYCVPQDELFQNFEVSSECVDLSAARRKLA